MLIITLFQHLCFSSECDEMLEGLAKELKLTENWKENTKMLFEEAADAKRGVEIIETEEEGWRRKCSNSNQLK